MSARIVEARGDEARHADVAHVAERHRWAGWVLNKGQFRSVLLRLRSWTLQEPQIERREHQDNSDVHYQPLPEPVPEEQNVHADHDSYQHEHVKHDGCSHLVASLNDFVGARKDYCALG